MSIADDIARLAAVAEPLRALAEDDPARQPLAGIVDEINKLRVLEANEAMGAAAEALAQAQDDKSESDFEATVAEVSPIKRGPGRPKKVAE